MTVESQLVALLSENSGVREIAGDRIYPVEADESQESDDRECLPYVVYELVASVPIESPSAGLETNESVLDLACNAATYQKAKELAAAVRTAIISSFPTAVIEDSRDQRDSDTRRKAVVQTYRIWHEESFP